MRAKDIMSTDIVTVSPESTVEEAAKLMADREISGIPVINSQNDLVGIITEGDLLGKHKRISPPGYIEFLGGIVFTESQDEFFEQLRKYVATQVKDLMSDQVVTVGPEAGIEEIATTMDQKNVKRLPVVGEGKLLGIVSRADLLKALL
ncbi:CBS domain-containing protein [Natranaerobius thermophilus]|uniref:CBS domain containing membrane protein n=1 Tax=Natranaerobius thermophilus (strain ATCC BAA-1301 / DSM 18059 / JW/NM-WN-LF) TaxID=457570 RepID=B2A4Y1_NATTJ|nr:CBS domain-containing protein [Natranaerobius thermophilus]ACB83903.1 CBS domain containing membrane protein [Natranaerobius thermophilus JW/NM-WN-LF]